jgi:hypothetical protein
MKKPVAMEQSSRREMLRLSGIGILGGVAVNALTSGEAQAGDVPIGVSYASWIHGHSMQIEYPDRIANQRRTGMSFDIEGKGGTDNWFHFAIPTPVIINDVRLQVDSVMLCFWTESADAFVQHVHVYDGRYRIAEFNDGNWSGDQPFVRLTLPGTPAIGQGLGISLGVGFGVEPMSHKMEFYSAGCDFVIRPVG